MAPTSGALGKLQQITGGQELKNRLGTAEPPPAPERTGAIKKGRMLFRALDYLLP